MNTVAINQRFIALVNREVGKLQEARAAYPESYINRNILPQHEKSIAALVNWRYRQVSAFSAFGVGPRNRQQTVDPRVAQINAIYAAAIAVANNAYHQGIKQIDQQVSQMQRDANSKIKLAQKSHDLATVQQLQSLIKQAKTASAGQKNQLDVVRKQAISDALVSKQQALAMLTQPSSTSSSPATLTTPFPGMTVTTDTSSAQPPITVNVTSPSPVIVGGGDGGAGGAGESEGGGGSDVYVQQTVPQPQVRSDNFNSPFDFSWLSDLFDFIFTPPAYSTVTNAGQPAPVAVAVPRQGPADDGGPELDIFTTDPWSSHAYTNAFGIAPPIWGNRTVQLINNLPVVPSRAIGFGQWAQIAGAVIQAGAQIGAAKLAPQPRVVAPPAPVVQQSLLGGTNTALIIGGVAAFGLLAIMLATRKR